MRPIINSQESGVLLASERSSAMEPADMSIEPVCSTDQNSLLIPSDINHEEEASVPKPQLKHHYLAIYLILLYIPIVIAPWVATVIMFYRPLSRSTYYYQEGFEPYEHKRMQCWVTAISVLNSVASILTVPVISFIIAQTAVIFSQKRPPARQLSVRDVFALADRAWTDISVLLKLVRAKGHRSSRCKSFITLASSFLLISAVKQSLYQILVDWKSINIPSRIIETTQLSSTLSMQTRMDEVHLGTDPEPAAMEMIPHLTVVQSVQSEFSLVKPSALDIHVWIDYNGTQPPPTQVDSPQGDALNNLLNIRMGKTPWNQNVLPAFFAAIPFNTTTGTRRYHVIRFNSTVECEYLLEDEYPTDCPGIRPYKIRVCAPGRWGTSPWTLSRNRQDIEEVVYLQFSGTSDDSLTMRCSSATTRGYFELGNYRNNGAYGPLLQQWPSPEVMEKEFNDQGLSCISGDKYSCESGHSYIPEEQDDYRDRIKGWTSNEPDDMRWNASGPLVTTVMALFGNDSWIRTTAALASTQDNSSSLWWNPLCERQPLYQHGDEQCQPDKTPGEEATQWLHGLFADAYTYDMQTLIFNGVVLANKAILLAHRDSNAPHDVSVSAQRVIYSSPGFFILKPDISLASIIIISVLLALQTAGLIFCGIYISLTPTWTRAFNAMAIASIGASLDKSILPVDGQYAEDEDYEKLTSAQVPLAMASRGAIKQRPMAQTRNVS